MPYVKVAVATFANQGHAILVEDEPCFGDTLAYASTQTKLKIRNVLENIGTPCDNSRSCSLRSTSRYSSGLWKAFDFLRQSSRARQYYTIRHRCILVTQLRRVYRKIDDVFIWIALILQIDLEILFFSGMTPVDSTQDVRDVLTMVNVAVTIFAFGIGTKV